MNFWEVIGEFLLDNWEKIGILLAVIFKGQKKTTEEKIAAQERKNEKQLAKLEKGIAKKKELEKEKNNA